MSRSPRLALVATTALALLVGACSGGEAVDTGQGDGAGQGQGAEGGGGEGGTLVAAISGRPDQLDPHKTTAYPSFQVLENVYDTLVVPEGDDLTFAPSLAEEWETSEDGLEWTFRLRDDVVFHDGSTFDAEDVVYSFNRIKDEELANAFRFASVEEVRAEDEHTVVLQLTEPTPNLLANVGGFKGMAILPSGAADEYDLATEAIGTGPFELGSSGAGSLTLTAFEDYWGEGPFVDEVEIRYVSESAAALTSLRSGEVHWTDNVPPQQVESLEGDDAVEVGRTGSVDYWYMAMNIAKEPFDSVEFRRAVAFAVDRAAVTEAAHFGAATPNQTAIPERSFWHTGYAPFETDVDQARQLIEESGASTPVTMGLMVTDEFPQTVTAAQVIESQLEPLGIEVQIQTEDFATWLDRQGQGDFDAFLLGWLGNLDPFGFYHAQHLSDGSFNFHGYSNPEVDSLLQQAAVETDQDRRKQLYAEAEKLIVDEVSYLYLYNPDVVQAWVPEVEGYEVRADRAVNFDTVRLGG